MVALSTRVFLTCLAVGSGASASGFNTARFGGEHGYAATSDPTAVYYNPAALTLGDEAELMLDGNVALRRASFSHEDAEPLNSGTSELTNVMGAPSLFASVQLDEAGALGFGVFAPFGGTSRFDADGPQNPFTPGAEDGAARWHNIEGSLLSLYLSGAGAYRLGAVSLGASVSAIRTSVADVRAHTLTFDSNANPDAEKRSLLEVSGWQMGFGLGVLYEAVAETLWLGLSYQSQPNLGEDLGLEGRMEITDSSEPEVALEQRLPDVIRAALRGRAGKDIELRVFGDYTRWSVMSEQCVVELGEPCLVNPDGSAAEDSGEIFARYPRDWVDAYGVRVGGSYWPSEPLEVFAGLGYDSNAVPDETLDAALMDGDDFSGAAGLRYQLSASLRVAASYTYMYFLERDTTGKSKATAYANPSSNPDSGGVYTHSLNIVNASLLARF